KSHRGELPLMDDGQGSSPDFNFCEGAQRDHLAGGGFNIDLVQRLRRKLEVWLELKNNAVLVELGENRRDLALPEGIVKGVVNRLREDVKAGRLLPVYLHAGLQTAGLLVGGDIAQFGLLAEFG